MKKALCSLATLLLLLLPFNGWAATYVIVHGAWGGGWAFKEVDRLLSEQGHEVYRATLTGLGERMHLATAQTDLNTHIQDVVNLIQFEQLDQVILVGHSYGGMVITGVYDRLADNIQQLIYVDAMLPEDGENVMDMLGRRGMLVKAMTRGDFILLPRPTPDAPPYNAPQPKKTFYQPITLQNNAPPQDKALYILTVEEGKDAEDDHSWRHAQRAESRGWRVIRMAGDHNVQRSNPGGLVNLLSGQLK